MHHPRKRFGQHFLCDQHYIAHIVQSLHPKAHDHLIEIGPGQGALTLPVLKQAKQLDAIELDRDLIAELHQRCDSIGKLNLINQDVLTIDFKKLQVDSRPLRIFGNLPYNISTPLIFHLLDFAEIISDMVFMLQKEVAERIVAGANEAHYGRLSIMVQYYCQAELLFDVPPDAFFPPPKVTSSIIKLTPYHQLPMRAKNYNFFADLVKHAFGQRRKTIRNSLKTIVSDEMWEQLNFDAKTRPENISLQAFIALSNDILALKNKGF